MRIGIDPGLTGAIAIITDGGVADVIDMPVRAKISKKGMEVDYYTITEKIQNFVGSTDMAYVEAYPTVYIENVHALPKQSVTAMFNFGDGYGAVKCAIGTLGYPMKFITPQAWKKKAGLIKKDKDESRLLAIEMFPTLSEKLKRKKDHNRAEALLIARFGSML